jgi:hypothetical protein
MEKYISIRATTALYLSIFFIALHHVFAFLINSSALKYIFGLRLSEVLSVYGIASLFGVFVYFILLKKRLIDNIKRNIYFAAIVQIVCLISMYYFSIHHNVYAFIGFFLVHHMITPYILFNLDVLFESYTHIKDRGRGRGIYLTVWNIPFVVVPLMMSTLSTSSLAVCYLVSSALLLPFLFLVFSYIKNPAFTPDTKQAAGIIPILKNFFKDKLDRNAFITLASLHLFYGTTGTLLPLYLHGVFGFEWNKIGLIFAAMTSSFVLIQLPFGSIEDKKHNEKLIFKIGLATVVLASTAVLMISPTLHTNTAFALFTLFLFLSYSGCSLIEISSDSMFYKHVTDRDHNALLILRAARIVPYMLGILAVLFI